MVLRTRVDPTSERDLAAFWLPRLTGAASVQLADIDDAMPAPGARGAYLWLRRAGAGEVAEVLYAGSGVVRERIARELKKVRAARRLDRSGIEVAHLVTDGPAIASLVELLAIGGLAPEWQGTGFGSNLPGSTRAGQRRNAWDTAYLT